MKSVRRIGVVLLLVVVLAACQSAGQGDALKVSDAWSRPAASGGNGAIYMVIDNPTGQEDTLLKAECAAAGAVEMHRSSMDADGNMRMDPQEKIDIPAGANVKLEPGGLHIMLINLKEDLTPGQTLQATLTFQNAGTITVEAAVREP